LSEKEKNTMCIYIRSKTTNCLKIFDMNTKKKIV
jgi:hypothetical protein